MTLSADDVTRALAEMDGADMVDVLASASKAMKIAERLAAIDDPGELGRRGGACFFCHANFFGEVASGRKSDYLAHRADCLWLAARALVNPEGVKA